jgi:MoxR-like ATPase
MKKLQKKLPQRFLRNLGVFGFDGVEPLILASLVSEDPVLLIGESGTGKTFLLNSISEAMQLEHRHYNASLISFDDLIGFPAPAPDGKSIRFLPTPATVWEAESVLIDELSRCKPEVQNKFFSIVHERKIQGIELNKLKYRWAAMNPFKTEDPEDDGYEGSQPLDQALADRFSFIIKAPDWSDLKKDEQLGVIHPAGENAISSDNGSLLRFVNSIKPVFKKAIEKPSQHVINYVLHVAGLINEAGMRFSPRRVRLLTRNITALMCVHQGLYEKPNEKQYNHLYKLALTWSIPHRAFRSEISDHLIQVSHREAIRLIGITDIKKRWEAEFFNTEIVTKKIELIFDNEIDADTKSIAVVHWMAKAAAEQKAIFAFACYPALSENNLLNEDALSDVFRIAAPIMEASGSMQWRERTVATAPRGDHPAWPECLKVLKKFSDAYSLRKERAKQLFLHLILYYNFVSNASAVEAELHDAFTKVESLLSALKRKSV